MNLFNKNAEIYISDTTNEELALSRTTYMSFAAHQDDVEVMALDGILKCFGKNDQWFSCVVATNGIGSPRSGIYSDCTSEELRVIRNNEQKKAAFIGEYSATVLLDYSSENVKDKNDLHIINDFYNVLMASKPKIIYTHNLADKHDTHIGVVLKLIKAIRMMDKNIRPEKIYGVEVWRNLDWLDDEDKVLFDVSEHPNMVMALISVFDSQIAGGKRYDLATQGRQRSNATYRASHDIDKANGVLYAMDMTELIKDDTISVVEFINKHIDKLKNDVNNRIEKIL